MTEREVLQERIHKANIEVHRIEAAHYDLFHPEVYSKQEQKRIVDTLRKTQKNILRNHWKALDFGAGTGNITGKLLDLGYTVTAVDISSTMCRALRKKYQSFIDAKKLRVINSPIENVNFGIDDFDLITCYSVLHHLPDYISTLRRLCNFLKKGGIMLLDHEASPYYWTAEPTLLANLIKSLYFHSNPILNSFYFQIIGFKAPIVDYSMSDYWFKSEHFLDHKKLRQIFKEKKFESCIRTDYYLRESWILNPVFWIYKHLCRPETSRWIAKK